MSPKNAWKQMDTGCRFAIAVSVLTFGLVAIHLAGGDTKDLVEVVRVTAHAASVLTSSGAFSQ